ncbi:DsrE family protein [Sulfurovum sp.]|uniref:DsrE family protein n=1 Tax=Sulfurovum sp. TaxID=1969726 RepID=UPI0025F1ADEB|nr:DsrE family protein [Sulfurovum sp.]
MKSFILLIFVLLITALQAKEYKVIYDCSSNEARYIKSRMWLVKKTMNMMQENNDTSSVVLTLHGGCVSMVSKNYKMIVPDEDVQNIKKAQKYLIALSKRKNVEIIVCAMSLASNAIEKSEVLPFVQISKNSFLDTIKYQNEGYAIMTFK